MSQSATQIDGGQELLTLTTQNPKLGSVLRRILDGVNRLASNTATSPTGELPSPAPVDTINVKGTYNASTNVLTAPAELLHAVATHNPELKRGIQYVWEVDTSPNFPQPHHLDLGAGRSLLPHFLPANDDSANPVNYFLRVTAQYHGSAPSKPTVFGGTNPIAIQMTGSSNMTLLPSQGAGTAFPQQGGQGIGKLLVRPSTTPKH